ncbi:DUF1269 domain-containing protein [Jiangella endophytica]|uniref:DUF1269 domain-containing protein n=1 Tax=Jiangella endophytica TaxID=1623398 RepID=UPI000E34CF1F|nr:DUF1269 domain-containing protein [Jiangella endophytica]
MATFTVWKFEDPTAADRAVTLLESLQKQELIQVHDAATVSWPADKKKPKTRQLSSMTRIGALGGAFWGLLFGLLFFVPLLGAAVGAAAGAIGGSLSDVGIDDDFIRQTRDKVTPGTSALFVLTSGAIQDKVLQAFEESGLKPELVQSNLTTEQEEKLRDAFAE